MKRVYFVTGLLILFTNQAMGQPEISIRNNRLQGAQLSRKLNIPINNCFSAAEKVFNVLGYKYDIKDNSGLYQLELTVGAVKKIKDRKNTPGGKVPGYMKLSPSVLLGSLIYTSDFYVVPHRLTVYIRPHSHSSKKSMIYFLLDRADGKKFTRRDRTYLRRLIYYINERRYDSN